jgi:membrane associated rhomboid family serine protease
MYFFYYLPIGINTRRRRFPVMTAAYTAICIAVFILLKYLPHVLTYDLYNLVYVPEGGGPVSAMASAFLHVGYAHLIGNLVYLTFFGRYV